MEALLVIAGLVVIAVPVTTLVLVVLVVSLRRQVAAHSREISALHAALNSGASSDAQAAPAQSAPAQPPTPKPQRAAPPAARVVQARKADTPPRGPALLERTATWVAGNWFYVVSAISLGLAGLFLVQYGVENGLFPPAFRVLGAIGFGAALVVAGEVIRRRSGDDAGASTAYLPSVFCSAGIVSMFGGVLAARLLYDLIGAELALAGLVAVALLALVIGWLLGPLLAAVGLMGAFAAPFVVGGSSEDTSFFFAYFTLIASLGLGIDTLRRWAWVSVLSVVMGFAAIGLLWEADPGASLAFGLSSAALAVLAALIPARGLVPDHAGPMLAHVARAARPIFPVWLAGGALAVGSGFLVILSPGPGGGAEFWLAVGLLFALAGLWIVWSRRAPALQDQAALPVLGLLAAVALQADRSVARGFRTAAEMPEGDFPFAVSALVGIGLALSLLAAWRSLRGGPDRMLWAVGAALVAPALAVVTEVTWQPALAIGAYPWALHAAALAVFMTALAVRFAGLDGSHDRLRAAVFVLSALACMAFALLLILSLAALTAALAVTVLAAALLDRRFDLRPMGLYVAAGVATIGYRLLADPGLDWALAAPWAELTLSHGAVFGAFALSLAVLPARRDEARLMLDSALWSVGALSISVIAWRLLETATGFSGEFAHWTLGLLATIWIAAALAQLQRLSGRRALRWVRAALAGVFGLVAIGPLAAAILLANPLLTSWGPDVVGLPLLNTLAVAYLLPALVLGTGALRLRALPVTLRAALGGAALGLGALWAFAAIRHVWQGAEAMRLHQGMGQGELYTYTVALLLIGAGLFYQSLARGSSLLRRAGLVVLGLAVAKVFFVDISGLGGLVRVVALLVLGLALAGLAWLDRWAQSRGGGAREGPNQSGGSTPTPPEV
ncbi:MAG: DUF2339 domain-containing protein [Pseudomonadota bacterium]